MPDEHEHLEVRCVTHGHRIGGCRCMRLPGAAVRVTLEECPGDPVCGSRPLADEPVVIPSGGAHRVGTEHIRAMLWEAQRLAEAAHGALAGGPVPRRHEALSVLRRAEGLALHAAAELRDEVDRTEWGWRLP